MTAALTPEARALGMPVLASHSKAADRAYRTFCQTQEYQEAFYEAERASGVDTALWIAFARGFKAALEAEATLTEKSDER